MLAGMLTDFGARTGPVAFGGRGEFDGSMTGPFRRPRVEGLVHRRGHARLGHAVGRRPRPHRHREQLRDGDRRLDPARRIRDPRRRPVLARLSAPDGGEEIDARFRVAGRDLDSLRHAFEIDDYPVSGSLTGEFHLTGDYEAPLGFGAMTIEDGIAYGEPFEKGTASLRFDGTGVRLDDLVIAKTGGTIDGRGVRRLGLAPTRSTPTAGASRWSGPPPLPIRSAQPSGLIEFTAGGSGTFDAAALRRAVPRQRSVRRRRRRRPGHRHAGAARRRS